MAKESLGKYNDDVELKQNFEVLIITERESHEVCDY